jgi:hypothetical protein
LVLANVFMYDKLVVLRIRSIAFSLLTPFFFIKAVPHAPVGRRRGMKMGLDCATISQRRPG